MTRYSIKDSEVLQVQCSATRSGRQAVTTVERILCKHSYVPGNASHMQ
jgi:hypothetical protein